MNGKQYLSQEDPWETMKSAAINVKIKAIEKLIKSMV